MIFAALADYGLLSKAVDLAKEKSLPFKVGNIFSSDLFYRVKMKIYIY